MSETPPELEPYPWLPFDRVARAAGLKSSDDADKLAALEDCRQAAADWCETQRPDLLAGVDPVVFVATPKVVQAGVLSTTRLFGPTGAASYAELGGAGTVLALDAEVARLLGTGRYATPMVG